MITISSLKITLDILSLVAEIDEFKGAWRLYGQMSPERLNTLLQISVAESAGAISRMDGGKISDHEALILINSITDNKRRTAEEKKVVNLAGVLENIFRHPDQFNCSVDSIIQLHRDVYKQSNETGNSEVPADNEKPDHQYLEVNKREAGSNKNLAENESVVLLDELIAWVVNTLKKNKVHPLLVIGIFNAEFLRINPFRTGNRVICRLLTSYLLLKSGYNYTPYSSLDTVIEHTGPVLYHALDQTIESHTSSPVNWQPAVVIFLRVLQKHKIKLAAIIEREKAQLNSLPDLAIQILELIKNKGRITVSEASMITRTNPAKVKKNLDTLVAGHQLQKQGTTKGVWYSLNN